MGTGFQRMSFKWTKMLLSNGKFSKGHYYLIPLQIFFISIFLNTKVHLIHHAKFQPIIPSHFAEKVDFNLLAILVSVAILEFRPG